MDVPLVLGSPGLNDAAMHMLQACVPHRRMLPAGFGALTVSGAEVRGAVQVRARRDGGPAGQWEVTAVDAAGHTVLAVSGLRLRDVGPLEASAPWHPTLLAAALEGWAAEFGLDPALRVTVSCGQPGAGPPAPGGRRSVAGRGVRARPAGRLSADRPGEHARGLLLGAGHGWPGGQPARTGGTAPRGQCRPPHGPQQ